MVNPRLRFTLLGTFQYAIGEGEYKELQVNIYRDAILAYLVFSGANCKRSDIRAKCWARASEEAETALPKQLQFLRKWFSENGLDWQDYITDDEKNGDFFLKPDMYESDLQKFLKYYGDAEGAEEKEHDRLMSEADKCYSGDLLADMKKGWWIAGERAGIKAKAKKAKEAAERYTALEQEAEHPSTSEALSVEATSSSQATISSHIAPEAPRFQTHVQGKNTARRLGNTLWLTLMTIALLVVGFVLLWVKHRHDTTFTTTEATTITLPSRPVVFNAADWRLGNDPLPVGVTPEDSFTNLHFFRLRKLVAVPQDFTNLYVSISCGEKAHVVLAQLSEPEGNTEIATDGQTHRKWEWEAGRRSRTMNGQVIVEVVVWLGTKPGASTAPAIEGEYWFDLPVKEN